MATRTTLPYLDTSLIILALPSHLLDIIITGFPDRSTSAIPVQRPGSTPRIRGLLGGGATFGFEPSGTYSIFSFITGSTLMMYPSPLLFLTIPLSLSGGA